MESLFLGSGFDFWDLITNLILGGTGMTTVIFGTLYIIGLWRLFVKSGIKGWWALIPCANDYQLGRCAGREPEGRALAVFDFLNRTINVFGTALLLPFTRDKEALENGEIALGVILFTLLFINLVYSIRVYAGLIEVYGRKLRWLWLWIPFEWLPALIWGFSSKYQPSWKVSDIAAELERLATHGSADIMDEGLTVNLEDRSVREFFHKNVLLRDIHLSIPQGHMVLLLGGSGAGKTTFLNAVNGYEKANAQVMLNGTNMYTQYRKMQYEVGFVPQSDMIRSNDTVINTMMDAAKLRLSRDIPSAQRRNRVNEVLEIFGLTPLKNHLVGKLSGGQRKRLSIAMEFISNPSLFILDEPDSGLDGVMARDLFEHLRMVADTGKIVIVITHTPDRVIDLFDEVIVLAKDTTQTGRLAFYGGIEEARTFFGRSRMEEIVKAVNQTEEGGDGLADEFVLKFAEVQNG